MNSFIHCIPRAPPGSLEAIPYVVRKGGIYVLEEDYWDAIKALMRGP